MAYHPWRIGLEIQNGGLRALAAQRRRDGWQLRRWWQLPLPEDTLRGGSLHRPDALCETLTRWRRELPHFISLRLSLPATLVLQRRLAEPDPRLREPERGWYIEKMAARSLPVGSDALALDYRIDPHTPATLLVTAARKAELSAWLACLARAGLSPAVVEIAPCALRCMARQAGVAPDGLLLHRCDDHWLWVSPLNHPLHFGVFHDDDMADAGGFLSYVSTCYPPAAGQPVFFTSSSAETLANAGPALIRWSPLTVFRQLQPPLPEQPAAFAIAAGLALRPGDC